MLVILHRETSNLANQVIHPAGIGVELPEATLHADSPYQELVVDRMPKRGTVYLVGAGPGSADLITVRGLRLLQQSDVLLHDALISHDLISEASSTAEIISVGKRGYCVGSTRQETINEALVRYAREGKSVCRGGSAGRR